MSRVLVCDDEAAVRFAISEALGEHGHEIVEAERAEQALERLDDVDVLVTDLAMPGMGGMALLREVRAREPALPVIVITARGSERVAVEAMKAGAHDYLAKPFDVDELGLAVERAAETGRLRREARRAAAERRAGQAFVAESPAMRALLDRIERLARRDVTVLLRGETGTGKEALAAMLHALGPRAPGPLVRFNCAAIPAELAESELFGHAKGAFTGAKDARAGFFSRAHGGTLVLDEVGELPPAMQPKLLRALQDGEVQPVGAGRTEKVDVRVVACTHRDLEAEVRAGRFREDLYYRLAVVELVVPPLRARPEDVPALARAFAARYASRFQLDDVRLGDDLLRALAAREWPGNVRELENAVARMVALSEGGLLGVAALDGSRAAATPPANGSFRERVEAFERQLVEEALASSQGNRSEAARKLGLSRVTLLDRMKRLGIG
jgi:two-component system response regulator AtoC